MRKLVATEIKIPAEERSHGIVSTWGQWPEPTRMAQTKHETELGTVCIQEPENWWKEMVRGSQAVREPKKSNVAFLKHTHIYIYKIFIYLAASGVSCCTLHCVTRELGLWHMGSSCCTTCGTLFPQPGAEPRVPCIARQILNHWTTREGSTFSIYIAVKWAS